jgi:hypothetical protein
LSARQCWLFLLLSAVEDQPGIPRPGAETLDFGQVEAAKNSGEAGCYWLFFAVSSAGPPRILNRLTDSSEPQIITFMPK